MQIERQPHLVPELHRRANFGHGNSLAPIGFVPLPIGREIDFRVMDKEKGRPAPSAKDTKGLKKEKKRSTAAQKARKGKKGR
jgi:hypothetical protein